MFLDLVLTTIFSEQLYRGLNEIENGTEPHPEQAAVWQLPHNWHFQTDGWQRHSQDRSGLSHEEKIGKNKLRSKLVAECLYMGKNPNRDEK